MGTLKYLILVSFIGFFLGMRCGAVIQAEAEPAVIIVDDKPELKVSDAVLTFELERLKIETSKLELMLEEKNIDLNIQSKLIVEREKEIEYKSQSITSLQAAVDLQKKESGDENTQVEKVYARISELKKKVETLKGSIRNQKQELNSLELRADEAEKKAQDQVLKYEKEKEVEDVKTQIETAYARINELEKKVESLAGYIRNHKQEVSSLELRANEAKMKAHEQLSKYEKMENYVAERWIQIRQTEQALHIAEAIMLRAQAEAAAKTDDLIKAYGALLPPWILVHLNKFKALVASYWAQHGEPVLNLLREKVSEKVVAANKWANLHFDNHCVMQKWGPTMRKQWQQLIILASPHIKSVKARCVERFEMLWNAIFPHLVRGREFVEPQAKMVRKFSRPYIAKAASAVRPHLDKARVVLGPCTDQAAAAYRRFIVYATTCHYQLQGFVRQALNKYELTAALATKELAWFLASALLALPLFGILMLYPSICSVNRNAVKPVQRIHNGNGRKKTKAEAS